MLLFDEPAKSISSESEAEDKKEEELKKIIDEAAKDLEHEPQSLKAQLVANTPLQGDCSSSTSTLESHI